MASDNLEEQFDPHIFVDELIKEMGMQYEESEKLELLKKNMLEALMRQLYQAAEDNMEPESMEMVMDELKDTEDPAFILHEMIRTSPGAQVAMLEALDQFRVNTLEAFNQLKD